ADRAAHDSGAHPGEVHLGSGVRRERHGERRAVPQRPSRTRTRRGKRQAIARDPERRLESRLLAEVRAAGRPGALGRNRPPGVAPDAGCQAGARKERAMTRLGARRTTAGRFLIAAFACGLATAALAGGPLYTYDYENRIPFAWQTSSWPNGQVPIYTDLGALGWLASGQGT